MVAKDNFPVDLNKPLVFQVANLGEHYEAWLHEPSGKVGSRQYESELADRCGKTNWKVVAAIWLPVICWLILLSVQRGLAPLQLMTATGCGLFVWSLFEYFFHRFVFHMKPKSYWGIIFQFVFHGYHHKFPMDTARLLSPPGVTAAYCYAFWRIYNSISTPAVSPALLGGSLMGYLAYDLAHYFIHAAKANNTLIRPLKKYHLIHHYKDQSRGFGVTSSFWDHIFDTSFEPKAA